MNYIHNFDLYGEELSFEVFKDSHDRWDMKWIKQGSATMTCKGGNAPDAETIAKNAVIDIRYSYNFFTKGYEAAIKIHNEETN
jgi:hypothetical protein